jgi:hypothetical protein
MTDSLGMNIYPRTERLTGDEETERIIQGRHKEFQEL